MKREGETCVLLRRVSEKRPEAKPVLLRLREGGSRQLRPVVRAFHDIELYGMLRVLNPPYLHFQQEHACGRISTLVNPFYGLPMFITRPLDYPDDDVRVFACGVGDKFAEVIVIRVSVLVLDNDTLLGALHLGIDVRHIVADLGLPFNQFQIEPDSLTQGFQVLLLSEPRCEILVFQGPHVSYLLFGQVSQFDF